MIIEIRKFVTAMKHHDMSMRHDHLLYIVRFHAHAFVDSWVQ